MRSTIDEAIKEAVAPLATNEKLDAPVARLPTKEELAAGLQNVKNELRLELHETSEELPRHMDVWAERIHDDVKMVAESQLGRDAQDTRQHVDAIEQLRRLSKTDASQTPR